MHHEQATGIHHTVGAPNNQLMVNVFCKENTCCTSLSCFPQQLGRQLRKKTDVDGICIQENKNHGPLICDTVQSGTGIPIFQCLGMYYQIHKATHSLPCQSLSHLHKGVSDMSGCVQVYLPHSMVGGRNKNKQQEENTQDRKSELSLSAYCTLRPHICKTKSLLIQQNCHIKIRFIMPTES